jgi:hypothetical protein
MQKVRADQVAELLRLGKIMSTEMAAGSMLAALRIAVSVRRFIANSSLSPTDTHFL